MPNDCAGFVNTRIVCMIHGKAFNTLGIEMNLAILFARKAVQQFGKRALRPMTAVNEGRNHGDPQVSASRSRE